jgi:methionyl-tRNA formyltransferase
MSDRALRLVFMGSPAFALPALRALLDAGHEVLCVYAQPPRPAGRGHRPQRAPVHVLAEASGLPVRTPASLKSPEEQAAFAALAADAAVVAAYGLILPRPVLAAPRLGCFNIHSSLLPRWRGAAPIQRAILAGDTETGVTIMQMDPGLDTGPIVIQRHVPITAQTTAAGLHHTLAMLGAELIVEALDGIASGALTPKPQPPEGVTYAAKLERGEGHLDWSRPAATLERAVRALVPWPGTWFEHQGERIKVLDAAVVDGVAAADGGSGAQAKDGGDEPGTVLRGSGSGAGDAGLTVLCGEGALRLVRLQRPGRMPADAAEFLRGYPLTPGSRLG